MGDVKLDIGAIVAEKKALFERYLRIYLADLKQFSTLHAACAYSLSTGGKRLRPVLTMLACEALNGRTEQALQASLAVEMVHTFSLIHDDLPAIDNDDIRRGMPTCHKAFGEAAAILAGDALIFAAFAIIGSSDYSPEVRADLSLFMADACGMNGLLEGEYEDIMAEGKELSIAQIERIYAQKTAKLFELSIYAGSRIGGGTADQIQSMVSYGLHLGRAFQAIDDILDMTSSTHILGKTSGKDVFQDKATLVKALGLEGAKAWAADETGKAVSAIAGIPLGSVLIEFARDMLKRMN